MPSFAFRLIYPIMGFLLVCTGLSSYAQENDALIVDSLLQELDKETEKDKKADIQLKVGKYLAKSNRFKEAIPHYNKALSYFKSTGNNDKVARTQYHIAEGYDSVQQTDSALINLHLAKEAAKLADTDSLVLSIYNLIVRINGQLGNTKETLENATELLGIGKKKNNANMMGDAYHYIGITYTFSGDTKEAFTTYKQAYSQYEKAGNKKGMADVGLNIGSYFLKKQEPDSAQHYLSDALSLARTIDNKLLQVSILKTMSYLCLSKNDSIRLHQTLEEGIALTNSIGDKAAMSSFSITKNIMEFGSMVQPDSTGNNIVLIEGNRNKLSTLLSELQENLAVYKEISVDLPLWIQAYQVLVSGYALLEDHKNAFDNMVEYNRYKDSFSNTNKSQEFMALEKKMLEDAANAKIMQANIIRNASLVGGLLFLLAAGIAGYAYYQKRKDNRIIEIERNKSESLLLNILPHEVAEELKENGKSTAKQFQDVSVLFTDFANFTANSEKLGVQELLNELNICFTAFDNIMEKNGLEKIKTIGDAYLAVSGLPLDNPNHALNAVHAALEIVDYMKERKRQNPDALEIRIGIHSGPVIAGIVGVKKFAYDIWGDTVNTAARMEQSGEKGRVNISETTFTLTETDFTFEHRGKIHTKGKGNMDMYFVMAAN